MTPMLAEEIADLLETNGIGTVGTDIFIDTLPPNAATNALVLQSLAGFGGHAYLDTLYDGILFTARNTSAETAYKRLVAVRNLLHRGQNYDTPNFHIYFSHMTGGIEALTRSVENAMIYSLGINFIYRDLNIVS